MIFNKFGEVTNVVIFRNMDGTSKCSGIISFKSQGDVDKAIRSANGKTLNGKTLHIEKEKPKPKPEMAPKREYEVYVNNFHDFEGNEKKAEKELQRILSKFDYENIKIKVSKNGNMYALANFKDELMAIDFIKKCKNSEIVDYYGNFLYAKWSADQTEFWPKTQKQHHKPIDWDL